MPPPTLDYAPRPEFDTGRFVASYFQILAGLSVASMILQPILYDSLRIDLTPIFLLWAASALKRHSPTARKWVIGITGLALAADAIMVISSLIFGTDHMTVSLGTRHIENPTLPQVALVAILLGILVGVPFFTLMSERARQQFVTSTPRPA